MSGKSRAEKKKRADTKKKLAQKVGKAKVVVKADQEDDVLGNNAEVAPNPNPEPPDVETGIAAIIKKFGA